ncbi:hypothetical protein CQA62_06600 [Helicobacter cholecystus]|uniref:Uncharacterized protein n=1 Tax=Helicobacter cholecystus TaxID=45498 RepID=A0A3D8ISG0_9HELI|nr:hypothetical protein [Helicobacter cholecystus]RDU68132.1 hypothetical protein CQA62_06600 [Helicobacter cholecystus]VEJ24396.1 Uncharacterised protein [Helicobacter cholecystus]
MEETIKATIKSKDGTRVFALPTRVVSQKTQGILRRFFEGKESVTIEDTLSFLITSIEAESRMSEKNLQLQEEIKKQQTKIEELCDKLEHL